MGKRLLFVAAMLTLLVTSLRAQSPEYLATEEAISAAGKVKEALKAAEKAKKTAKEELNQAVGDGIQIADAHYQAAEREYDKQVEALERAEAEVSQKMAAQRAANQKAAEDVKTEAQETKPTPPVTPSAEPAVPPQPSSPPAAVPAPPAPGILPVPPITAPPTRTAPVVQPSDTEKLAALFGLTTVHETSDRGASVHARKVPFASLDYGVDDTDGSLLGQLADRPGKYYRYYPNAALKTAPGQLLGSGWYQRELVDLLEVEEFAVWQSNPSNPDGTATVIRPLVAELGVVTARTLGRATISGNEMAPIPGKFGHFQLAGDAVYREYVFRPFGIRLENYVPAPGFYPAKIGTPLTAVDMADAMQAKAVQSLKRADATSATDASTGSASEPAPTTQAPTNQAAGSVPTNQAPTSRAGAPVPVSQAPTSRAYPVQPRTNRGRYFQSR